MPPSAPPAGQMLNLSHLPPQLQQQLGNLPPMVQQQVLQQYIQRQQQQQTSQMPAQQGPPGPPPSMPQQPFTGQQPTAQMLAHMNSVINGQQGQQGSPAFNRGPMPSGQVPGKPFSLDDKGLPVHPSQMQNFLQAQARAQAQMQMQAAAAAAQQQQQQQAPPAFQQPQNHQSPQHTQYIRPNSMQNRQAPPSGPTIPQHIPPRVLPSAGPPTSSPASHMPQLPLQLQHPPQNSSHPSQPSQMELQHGANAVAGPSNPRAIAAAQHHRRPSIDQIALMQRLSQMAQKGGLPIQSLFTKTSWMASSEDAEATGDAIPTFTEWDKKNLESWMQKDLRSVELSKREKGRIREALEELAQTMIEAQDWLGPTHEHGSQHPQPQFHVRSRKEMERDLSRGKRKKRPWLEFSKKQLRNISKVDECLIPIRLDLEHEGRKCSDTFTWNLNDTLITPATFADVMCEDLLLPHDPFHAYIVSSIDEQIKQFQEAEESHPRSLFIGQASSSSSSRSAIPVNEAYTPNDVTNGATLDSAASLQKDTGMQDRTQPIDVDEEDENEEEEAEDWWDGWRKKVKLSQAVEIGQELKDIAWHEGLDTQVDLSQAGNEVPTIVLGQDELRITISLDIAVDNLNLRDQFEWDLSDPQNSPEEFAAVYCQDLGLPGEFRSAISHLIREQIDAHARSLSSIRHIRGDPILHDELRTAFHSILYDAIRSDDVENWTPHLGKLDLVELEHRERERERQSRRQKRGARNNRRNVVALPEREPLRTSRTIMPKPGAVLEVAENTGPDDPASIPTYEVAQPYPLVPVKYEGPPPRMSSPLRRTMRRVDPVTGALVADTTLQPVPFKAKPPGKRRGRPPADPAARALLLQQENTPPPGASAAVNAAPAGGPVEKVKRPVGRPPLIKKPAGWTRIEMTTHENIIDGKWHCTNCGVPEPVAVGRRKGPAGPNTQCAECGKYFMSNKGRLRPCQYTTDPEWHQARLAGYNLPLTSRSASQGPSSAQQPPDSPNGSVFEPESGDESKPSIHDESFETSKSFAKTEQEPPALPSVQRKSSTPAYPPGAGKGKGKGHKGAGKGLPPFPKQESVNNDQQRLHPHQQSLPPIRLSPSRINAHLASSSASPPNTSGSPNARPVAPARKRPEPPKWMSDEVAKLQRERPDDRFEIIPKPRSTPEEELEWRLKCLDCPGKVYKTGPDQTLDNFSAHLRFKGHRAAVTARQLAAIQP
ncbi:SNF5-domain-containing protein [Cystobasidium minutum MCA 4210]|uniref:SNF5-domain-containing protein n=1 Tax=Cystobasidium minutum MCA 4210 TaxID=1397322 RepID=UPI0034CFD3B1|eukprot:jgi/Rhomi1/168076/fgenesh1_kg.2_\